MLVRELARGRARRPRARLAAARPGGHRRRAGARPAWRSSAATSATPTPRERALDGADARRPPRRDRRRPGLRARPGALRRGQRRRRPRASSPTPARLGVERLVFASTCSNYGRMADPTVPITEEGELAPGVALRRAEGRHREADPRRRRRRAEADLPALRDRLRRRPPDALRPDRQRVHPRTVGRPRARGLRRAVLAPLHPRPRRRPRRAHRARARRGEQVAGQVFNVGRSGENYRKLDIVEEIGRQTDRGKVSYVTRDEDPRDYKVSFDKIRERARLRDADDRARRDRARSSRRSTRRRSATRSTPRYRNIP